MIFHLTKRVFDFFLSIFLLVVLFPILLVTSLVNLYFVKGNPFFTQVRTGKNGGLFRILKFKSMTDEKNSKGELLPDIDRLTKFGIFLRKSSIDELPQLINIFKGDMSFVGPRPLLPEYLELYSKTQFRRHDVKPGITGWAQVNGRNSISWQLKFELDVWYVDHQSLLIDFKIFWLTVLKVIKKDGVNKSSQVTMEKFKGKHDTIRSKQSR